MASPSSAINIMDNGAHSNPFLSKKPKKPIAEYFRSSGQAKSSNQAESPILAEIKEKLLNDPQSSFMDVTLNTSDGKKIRSSRFMLMLRSEYFEKMFSSGFRETCTEEVQINVTQTVFENVFEFMCTDDCKAFRELRPLLSSIALTSISWTVLASRLSPKDDIVGKTQTVLELVKASDYLLFPRLRQVSYALLSHTIKDAPFLFCTIWEFLWGKRGCYPHSPSSEMLNMLMRYPRFAVFGRGPFGSDEYFSHNPPNLWLLPGGTRTPSEIQTDIRHFRNFVNQGFGVNKLSFDSLKVLTPLVGDSDHNEHYFRMICLWATLSDKEISHNTSKEDKTETEKGTDIFPCTYTPERFDQAKSLMRHFNFNRMSCRFIVKYVDPSGFVSVEELRNIYRFILKRKLLEEENKNDKNAESKCNGDRKI